MEKPGLFGQKHSSRDYTKPYFWGKNQFNSSFPASLIAYMSSRGVKMRLADDCLDVFVWSNLSVILMCVQSKGVATNAINRFQRTIIWIYRMLFDYVSYGTFDYISIIKNHSYGNANDKAFALSGTKSYPFLRSKELEHPRISKGEIKNIILGGGQNMLSPERRFDAVIVNSTDLFE